MYTHWIGLDPAYLKSANKAFRAGSRYAIARVYNHPAGIGVIFEIISPDPYKDLDLNVNSLNSPLRRFGKKPPWLGQGITLRQFEKIYGKVDADEV